MPTDPADYKGAKIKAIPYDENARPASVLFSPIVSATVIDGYLPLAAVDNGDGTATLKVETEIGDVVISNVNMNVEKWGGTLQSGANLTPLFQHLDVDLSTRATEATLIQVRDHLDTVEAKLQSIIDNTADLDINTDELEAKVQSVRDQLDVLLSTRATEATLAAILAKIDVIVDGETPSGTINGSNVTFTTANSWKPTTTHLFKNGVRLQEGLGFDYVEEADNVTLTLAVAPILGDTLLVDYRKL